MRWEAASGVCKCFSPRSPKRMPFAGVCCVQIRYLGQQYGNHPGVWTEPASPGGYMRVTSNLLFTTVATAH